MYNELNQEKLNNYENMLKKFQDAPNTFITELPCRWRMLDIIVVALRSLDKSITITIDDTDLNLAPSDNGNDIYVTDVITGELIAIYDAECQRIQRYDNEWLYEAYVDYDYYDYPLVQIYR